MTTEGVDHADRKMRHERAAGERFATAYGRERGETMSFREQPNPPAPDLVFEASDGAHVGVEIVTTYYSNADAQRAWSASPDRGPLLKSFNESLAEFVQERIEKKCGKTYEFAGDCLLVIEVYAPLSDEVELDRMVEQLRVPATCPFSAIYLGAELPISFGTPTPNEGCYRTWQLFPEHQR